MAGPPFAAWCGHGWPERGGIAPNVTIYAGWHEIIQRQRAFLAELDQLKPVPRPPTLIDKTQKENSAGIPGAVARIQGCGDARGALRERSGPVAAVAAEHADRWRDRDRGRKWGDRGAGVDRYGPVIEGGSPLPWREAHEMVRRHFQGRRCRCHLRSTPWTRRFRISVHPVERTVQCAEEMSPDARYWAAETRSGGSGTAHPLLKVTTAASQLAQPTRFA